MTGYRKTELIFVNFYVSDVPELIITL